MRLQLHVAAYVLHQQLRTQVLKHRALGRTARLGHLETVQNRRTGQTIQSKDRGILHLPSACAVKHPLHCATELLFLGNPPAFAHSS
jgi:hypothetical protein